MQIEHDGQMIAVYNGYVPTGQQRYSEPFKEYCFSLYVGEAGKSVPGTSRIVKDRHDIDLHPNTIYLWRKEGNWDVRARELYQLLRPGVLNDTLDTIVTGASEGAHLLRKMLSGEERPDATRMKIAFGLMDRAGLMPHSAVAEHIRLKMADAPATDTAALSDAELRELEASYQPDALHIPEAEIPEGQVVLAHNKRRAE